jgi:excisionase family DNA binding protein
MSSTETSGRLLSVAEVAERLGASRGTVHRLVRDRGLEAIQFGEHGALRIPERALDHWLEEHRIGNGAP